MSTIKTDKIKFFFSPNIIATCVFITYLTIAIYFIYSQFMPLQATPVNSRVHVGIDSVSSGHFVGEIQKTPSDISFRWLDRRVAIQVPRFLNYGVIVSFTTWLHPVADAPHDGAYDIVSIDKKVFTTQSSAFVPRTYHILSLPTIYTGPEMYLFVPYVFASDTPYWAYSGVTAQKIDVVSAGSVVVESYVWFFTLLMLLTPFLYVGICWYVTRNMGFSSIVGLVFAIVLFINSLKLYDEYIASVFQQSFRTTEFVLFILLMHMIPFLYISICWYATRHVRFSLAVGLGVVIVLALQFQTFYEGYDALVLQGKASQRILMAVIVMLIVALIVTLYHRLSPFWQNIKHVLYIYMPVVHMRLFVVTAVALASLWCVVVFTIYDKIDWPFHENVARDMQTQDGLISYFLYHMTIVVVHNVTLGLLSLKFAAILLVFFIILLLCTMVWNMSASILPNPIFLVGAALLFLVFAPIPLLFLSDGRMYFGYIGVNAYHNPTVLMLKPFALMHILLLHTLLSQEGSDKDVVLWRVFWGVTLLTVLAKASYIIVMLPALGLLVGWQMVRQYPQWRHSMIVLIVMGSALVLPVISQYLLIYNSGARGLGFKNFSLIFAEACMRSNEISWTCVLPLYGGILVKLIGSLAFILSLRLVVPNIMQKIEIQLLGIATGISLAYCFLLVEGESYVDDRFVDGNWGNWAWSAQISLFLLLFIGIRYLATATVQHKGKKTWYIVIPYVIATMHIVSGFFWAHRNIVYLFAW